MSTASTKNVTLALGDRQGDYKAGVDYYLSELGKILRRMQNRRERLNKAQLDSRRRSIR